MPAQAIIAALSVASRGVGVRHADRQPLVQIGFGQALSRPILRRNVIAGDLKQPPAQAGARRRRPAQRRYQFNKYISGQIFCELSIAHPQPDELVDGREITIVDRDDGVAIPRMGGGQQIIFGSVIGQYQQQHGGLHSIGMRTRHP